jgi:hypothetical protein
MSRFRVDFGVSQPDQYINGDRSSEATPETRISYQMRLPSDIFCTTAPDRFEKFEIFLNGVLARVFPRAAPLDIHDLAASDVIRTMNIFNLGYFDQEKPQQIRVRLATETRGEIRRGRSGFGAAAG